VVEVDGGRRSRNHQPQDSETVWGESGRGLTKFKRKLDYSLACQLTLLCFIGRKQGTSSAYPPGGIDTFVGGRYLLDRTITRSRDVCFDQEGREAMYGMGGSVSDLWLEMN
jgi:hypothetical protein